MKTKSSLLFLALSLLVLLLAACGQNIEPSAQTPNDEFIQEKLIDAQETDQKAIIEELKLDNGNIVRFIDESLLLDGAGVGVLELIANDAQPVLSSVQEANPTALELYKLLQPNKAAPQVLLDNHDLIAAKSTDVPNQARELSLNSDLSTQESDSGLLWSVCYNSATFQSWYNSKLHNPNNFKGYGFGANLQGTNYGVTAVSNRRALSVCHHPNNHNVNVQTRIEMQFGANLWFLIPGTIHNMQDHRGMWYASQGFTSARYRVKAQADNLNARYSIAGSWGRK